MGVKGKVNSPTFVIMKRYELKNKKSLHDCKNFLADKILPGTENFFNHAGFKMLFHLDAYRLKNEKELLQLGWEEIIADPNHIVFIEWPEKIIKVMPKKHHKVEISHMPTRQAGIKEGYRKFKIRKT